MISGQFGVENYSWKIAIIFKIFVNIAVFLFAICYAKLNRQLSTKMCRYPQTKMFWTKMNCAWKFGKVQNLCKYCKFFLYGFLSPKCCDTHNSHTTSMYAKLFENLVFFTPWCVDVHVRIRALEMFSFWKTLLIY